MIIKEIDKYNLKIRKIISLYLIFLLIILLIISLELFNFKKYENKKVSTNTILKNNILPIKLSIEKQTKLDIIDEINSKEEAIEKLSAFIS